MSETTELILEGVLCESCGGIVGSPVGFPRTCDDCEEYYED